jgi:alkylglycerol monooxygenase
METNYLAFVIPAFFLFVGIEYLVSLQKKQKHLFKFDSSVTNISIGIAERLINLFIASSLYGMFEYIYQEYALFSIPNHWLVWILLLMATDFVWYWYHRLGHEINIFWGSHIVHHQSEEFNYTVSARVTTLQAIIRNFFWCVLPLIGFHPAFIMVVSVVHAGYSFFTHTQVIGKLGWIEYILITPSHHRVHHASNEKYINKNYGDLFVFWDKLFGTFQKEEEKPVYGLTHPLRSQSFIWQHFHYYLELLAAIKKNPTFKNILRILFGPPELLDQEIRPKLEKKILPEKREVLLTLRFRIYLIAQLIMCLSLLFLITYFFASIDSVEKITGILFTLITLINCGALLEQRRWIFHLEYIRVMVMIFYFSFLFQSPIFLIIALIVICLIVSMESVQNWYFEFVYQKVEAGNEPGDQLR